MPGEATRFGPGWPGKRCGAKRRRDGKPCEAPGYSRNGRCRVHGGASTGPRTEEGKARMRIALTKTGVAAGPNHPSFPDGKHGPRWRDRKREREIKQVRQALAWMDR